MREPVQLEFDFMRPEPNPVTLDDVVVGLTRAKFALEHSSFGQAVIGLQREIQRLGELCRLEQLKLDATLAR